MKIQAFLVGVGLIWAVVAEGAVVERVEGTVADRNLRVFFKNDVDDLEVGEILEVRGLNTPHVIGRIAVEKIDGQTVEASVLSIYGSSREMIRPGQEVVTNFEDDGSYYAAFQVGSSNSKKVGVYGGSHVSVALQVGFRLSPELSLAFLLQADPLGESADGFRKVSGSYMGGVQWEQNGFNSSAYLGVQDLLTRHKNASAAGATHDDRFSWLLQLGYDMRMKSITRRSPFGWSWGPYVNTLDAFSGGSGFSRIFNVGLNIKMFSGGR